MFSRQLLLLLTSTIFYTTHKVFGYQLYDTASEICCNGRVDVLPVNKTDVYRCCGSQPHLTSSTICCSDTIIPYPYNFTNLTPGEQMSWGCCKSGDHVKPLNRRIHRCCEGNVIDVTEGLYAGCCGKTTFDYRKYVCCGNVLHPIDHLGETGCCDDQLFNSTTHLCCSQWPVQLDTDDFVHGKPQYKLHQLSDDLETKSQHTCCGLGLYNLDSEVCCDGIRLPVPDNSSSYGCCGVGLYNYDREMCCGGLVKTKAANLSCCSEAGQFYDATTHVCCEDTLVVLPTNHNLPIDRTGCCRKRQ